MAEETEAKAAVKRGRGRPPKPESERKTPAVKKDEDGEPQAKRGRGRPKGSTKAKGRGRPKGTTKAATPKKVCTYRVFFFLWIQSGSCKSAILRSFKQFLYILHS